MSSIEESRNAIKLVVIGDSGVGKTSLIMKSVHGCASKSLTSTVSADLIDGKIIIKNTKKTINVDIWDIGGGEKSASIANIYFGETHGCIIVYDITNKSSFERVDYWWDKFHNGIKNKPYKEDVNIPVILLGNKADLSNNREVSKEEGEKAAKKYGIQFYEVSAISTSAETCTDVKVVLSNIGGLIYKELKDKMYAIEENDKVKKVQKENEKKSKKFKVEYDAGKIPFGNEAKRPDYYC